MPEHLPALACLLVLTGCIGRFTAAADDAPPPPPESPFADLLDDDRLQANPEVQQLLQQHRAHLSAPLPRDKAQEAAVLRQLAEAGDAAALAYLHLVFETYPERRNLVALAVARYAQRHRRRAQDWRLLVRALNVVEGPGAEAVVGALLRFPQRATRPRWIRTALLHALRAEPPGVGACLALLEKWTNHHVAGAGPAEQLAAWQKWFVTTWPGEPPPRLPVPAAGAPWHYEPLAEFLYSPAGLAGDPRRGAQVFQRAACHKCHRFGGVGERMGPDLTQIAGRMQRKEILHALLYPSEYVSDQYQSYTLATVDGRTLTGVVGAAADGRLMVLQPNGEKVELPRDAIDTTVRSRQSAMPTGTLSKLSRKEIADLFAYLCAPAE